MPMVNDTNNSKLDKVVKQTLSNYEAPFSSTNWAKMESMLEATPKSSNFKWSGSLNILIGLVVLAGVYLIVDSLTKSEKAKEVNTENQQPVENKVEEVTKPVTISSPSVISAPAPNIPQPKPTITPVEPPKAKPENISSLKSENTVKEKDERVTRKPQQVIKMGNEPIFGDMLDSTKGIVTKTREKEATKKAAVSQPVNSIGWNNLLKSNLDSLRKHHEQQQKDSLKK